MDHFLTPAQLHAETAGLSIAATLAWLTERHPGAVTFSSSFSYEDQVITQIIAAHNLPVSVFTLDTGRLFSQTYTLWQTTRQTYDLSIKAYYPDAAVLEAFVETNGPDAFYQSVEHRKNCCHIRKVAPLQRALSGHAVWVTGLRAEHSPNRENLGLFEWDEHNRIIKYNPLLHWDTAAVKEHIRKHHVPYNTLHDQGYVSIGCAPCTRAIKAGEDFRAGRWWWEDNSKKECGLHRHPSIST
ncbi:phosphoadenylyl-sulfate reductase [Taibaiella chishuiensis]|uniref:Adenosine 5'-phosphosulfate reductase n=1 Tax=Taibaiella chishuiensis TaxID=1434707 RepID=A0A2P8CR45_9BACT|nr:phosphoadenylyl-sulfate reductase [Taibaiella chishuiensis]PSK87426.1 phosphoadenosine phosphosulfate reductase [Taibaiella chishuiensis]